MFLNAIYSFCSDGSVRCEVDFDIVTGNASLFLTKLAKSDKSAPNVTLILGFLDLASIVVIIYEVLMSYEVVFFGSRRSRSLSGSSFSSNFTSSIDALIGWS